MPYVDEAVTAAWGEAITRATSGGGFLLGRRTYLDLIEAWPKRAAGHPYTQTLTETPKYVASTTLTELRRLMVGGLYSYRVFTDKGRHMLAASPRLPHLLQIFGHGGLWPPAGKVSTIVLEQGKGREL